MMVNSCCANGMDLRMRGFSDSLSLSARIRTAYNAGKMWTRALSGRENRGENWIPILVIRGVVTIRQFASSSYVVIVFIGIFLGIKMECCYHVNTLHIYV